MSRPDQTAPLVLGAGGMLGSIVTRALEREFPGTMSATRAEIDVTDRFRMEAEVERLQPTVVINCTGFTDVDGCETDPDRARRVNAEGAENAARAAAGAGCRLVHISTDYVFDGRSRRPYVESAATGPLSTYGRTKLEGEERVAAAAPDHLIVRTAWLYGHGRSNFVEAIRARARAGGTLRVVEDQVGSPTYAADLADGLIALMRSDYRGTVHFANKGLCSRLAMARSILEILRAESVRLEAITTLEAGRIAVRPAFSALDTGLYERLTGDLPRPWEEALRRYLDSGPGDPVRDA